MWVGSHPAEDALGLERRIEPYIRSGAIGLDHTSEII
jgi:hypothetical protein